ncbi:MAG TPA: type II toxin-antitoxin system RelE/ParE family toxin [Mycobacteriales bacterium]|nr:type II toxin-antitoxin system RelE/ParE family toxin [Mycobacteriales bacterium]
MTYRVEVRPAAERALRRLPGSVRDRISKVVTLLAEDPRPPAAKMLVSNDSPRLWRVRTGDYRIVYQIYDDVLVVLVVAVGHRREIYDR